MRETQGTRVSRRTRASSAPENGYRPSCYNLMVWWCALMTERRQAVNSETGCATSPHTDVVFCRQDYAPAFTSTGTDIRNCGQSPDSFQALTCRSPSASCSGVIRRASAALSLAAATLHSPY